MKAQNKNKFAHGNIKDFSETKGYFIGQFMGERGFPHLETEEVEIAWKKLPTIFNEDRPHFHKTGVEINIVIKGSYKVWLEGKEKTLKKGDFLIVYPEAKLKNISAGNGTELIVVKAPSIPDDKFGSE
jgi:mannose-6-phosphate isomerase-like protein (cupin superfamily)